MPLQAGYVAEHKQVSAAPPPDRCTTVVGAYNIGTHLGTHTYN